MLIMYSILVMQRSPVGVRTGFDHARQAKRISYGPI